MRWKVGCGPPAPSGRGEEGRGRPRGVRDLAAGPRNPPGPACPVCVEGQSCHPHPPHAARRCSVGPTPPNVGASTSPRVPPPGDSPALQGTGRGPGWLWETGAAARRQPRGRGCRPQREGWRRVRPPFSALGDALSQRQSLTAPWSAPQSASWTKLGLPGSLTLPPSLSSSSPRRGRPCLGGSVTSPEARAGSDAPEFWVCRRGADCSPGYRAHLPHNAGAWYLLYLKGFPLAPPRTMPLSGPAPGVSPFPPAASPILTLGSACPLPAPGTGRDRQRGHPPAPARAGRGAIQPPAPLLVY